MPLHETSRPYTLEDLLALMRRLRDPPGGCPWDLQQTFASIVPHTLEECYELADCIERNDTGALHEELGDLLFQVVFYARLGEERGYFDFGSVVNTLVVKLLRRHPHVFPGGRLDDADNSKDAVLSAALATALPIGDSEGVLHQWEAIKAEERQAKALPSAMDDIPLNLPALTRAAKLQRRAARVGFDWSETAPVRAKVAEELAELAIAEETGDSAAVADEMGDLLFACVNLARHLDVDPEAALRGAGRKFERRFRYVEDRLQANGQTPQQAGLAAMDTLWDAAKRSGL